MKKITILFICLITITFNFVHAFESNVFGKGLDGQNITIEGYIHDEPRLHNLSGGSYQSYSFRVNAAATAKKDDEFISVSFQTVKLGKVVGTFNYKKGDKVTLTGKYNEFKGQRKTGIVGSLKVN
ncbi:hypothetical protein K2P97_01260 [bacterium]|nr:hypothetical protein [bacterium]